MSLSVPQVTCREQALLLVLELPGSLMDANTLATVSRVYMVYLACVYFDLDR